LGERLLSAVQVAEAQTDLPELVQRPSEIRLRVGEDLLAGQVHLAFGFAACPTQTEDLRPVHTAPAVDTSSALSAGPLMHCLGPFLGALVLSERLPGADHRAIHDGRGHRVELPRGSRHSGLIHERQPFGQVTLQDEPPGLRDPRESQRWCVVEPRGDLDGHSGQVECLLQLAGDQRDGGALHGQDAVQLRFRPVIQDPFDPERPPPKQREETRVDEETRDLERGARRDFGIPVPQGCGVQPRPRLARDLGVA
jgi:hypothetical protein